MKKQRCRQCKAYNRVEGGLWEYEVHTRMQESVFKRIGASLKRTFSVGRFRHTATKPNGPVIAPKSLDI